jgi:hypothetical protein
VRHEGCGGELYIGGSGTVDLPTGFGFDAADPEPNRFVVDCVRCKTYSGFCGKCGASGTFVRVDQKPTSIRKRTRHVVRVAN